jgi:electron transfer flavoprotein beta subunit
VVACPANLFVPTSDGGILFNYEQCFECGTCYLVCNVEGAITWTYPEGGTASSSGAPDRGTGSVPAFLADELSCAQALGLIVVDTDQLDREQLRSGPLRVVRRLDGGRREVLDVPLPAVMSVEGSVARLRRASLAASLAARTATVEVARGPHGRLPESEIHPFRPRARVLPAPDGGSLDRVRQILDIGGGDVHAELLTLDPPAAASKILDQLRDWGYLDAPAAADPVATSAARAGDSD